MPQLDNDVKEILEEQISKRDIEHAIEELADGKASEPDGLGSDFYKAFAPEAPYMLLQVFAEAYEKKNKYLRHFVVAKWS